MWQVTVGLADVNDRYLNEHLTEPRVSSRYELSPNWTLTAAVGKHSQMPREFFAIVKDIGNPNLEHYRAQHSVVGVTHDISKDWKIKSELYYKTFDNLVVGVPDERNYINDADGRAYGWELFIKKNHTDKLWGWLSFTLSRSEKTDDLGNTFVYDYDQPILSTLVTNYEFARFWTFGIKWQYHTGKPYDPIIGSEPGFDVDGNPLYIPTYGDKNSVRFPSYHRLDVRVDRDWYFNSWKLKAYFEILNFYNHCNVAAYEYDETYSEASKEEVCGIPFIPSLGIAAEF